MDQSPQRPGSETESLRQRLSLLSEASLRINESLDFDVVLQGVLDSACALTEARYGVLTPFDETGDIQPRALSPSVRPPLRRICFGVSGGAKVCRGRRIDRLTFGG